MVYVRIVFRCDWAITTLKMRDPYPKTMNGVSLDAILRGSWWGQRLTDFAKICKNRVWAFGFACLAETKTPKSRYICRQSCASPAS
jgi:hypothetical protein